MQEKKFHLQLRSILTLKKLNKARDDALADDLLDRRVPLCNAPINMSASFNQTKHKRQASDLSLDI